MVNLRKLLIFFLFKSTSLLSAPSLEFINEISFKTGTKFEKTEIGGLSGLSFDPTSNNLIAVSDDRSKVAPARFYTFTVAYKDEKFTVTPSRVTFFGDANGKNFAEKTADFEGVTSLPSRELLVASEGDIRNGLSPEILLFAADGKLTKKLEIPPTMQPTFRGVNQLNGAQNNFALESITTVPGTYTFLTGTENNLIQDDNNVIRVSQFNIPVTGNIPELTHEYLYDVDPESMSYNGLVEIVADSEKSFFSLERAYIPVARKTIVKIFHNEINGETSDVKGVPQIKRSAKHTFVRKTKVIDLEDLVSKKQMLGLDNFEGMTFGPKIGNDQTLVLVSDNNFSKTQKTTFLFFRIKKQ
jgi:hypothetical protein